MNSIDYNNYYVLIPFYNGEGIDFDNYMATVSSTFNVQIDNTEVDCDNLLLGFIDELFHTVRCYKINGSTKTGEAEFERRIYYFDTRMGFFAYRFSFSNREEEYDVQKENIEEIIKQINEEKYSDFVMWKNRLNRLIFFPAGNQNECLLYSFFIGEDHETHSFFQKTGNVNQIDKLHGYEINTNRLNIVTNQRYKKLIERDAEKLEEEQFRSKYEDSVFFLFLLLQHERQMYFWLRKQVVINKTGKRKEVSEIKDAIIDLLSRYSYTVASEEKNIHAIYSSYREVLKLSEYESSLSDLVFKLDEEKEKEKDKWMTVVSFVIGCLGLLQLISTGIDIFSCFHK